MLRVRVMRPSLEALGRFDAARAKARFLATFSQQETQIIVQDGTIAGFFVLRERFDHLYLDHLYIDTDFQRRGLGRFAVQWTQSLAAAKSVPVRLIALVQSPANAFYQSCGFVEIGRDGVDITYEWSSAR